MPDSLLNCQQTRMGHDQLHFGIPCENLIKILHFQLLIDASLMKYLYLIARSAASSRRTERSVACAWWILHRICIWSRIRSTLGRHSLSRWFAPVPNLRSECYRLARRELSVCVSFRRRWKHPERQKNEISTRDFLGLHFTYIVWDFVFPLDLEGADGNDVWW